MSDQDDTTSTRLPFLFGSLRKPAPPTREAIWAWLESAPRSATIGDGCRHFGLAPVVFIAIRDGKDGGRRGP